VGTANAPSNHARVAVEKLFLHGHQDHDEPLVACLQFAEHAPGDVGDDHEAGPHLAVDRRRDPVPEPVRVPPQRESTTRARRRELLIGDRVVVFARARRPGDGAPGKAGAATGTFAGVRQQGILADPAGPHHGDEGTGTDRPGHETRIPCR
jgi:hypothetical protein